MKLWSRRRVFHEDKSVFVKPRMTCLQSLQGCMPSKHIMNCIEFSVGSLLGYSKRLLSFMRDPELFFIVANPTWYFMQQCRTRSHHVRERSGFSFYR